MSGLEWLDRVLVFPSGLDLPCLDGGLALVDAAFIPDRRVRSKARGESFGVSSPVECEIDIDRPWQMDRHADLFLVVSWP